jgi:hypothetical protein
MARIPIRAVPLAPLALAILVAGCRDAASRAGSSAAASTPPPACEALDYPCIWADVPDEVVERGDALAEIGAKLLLGGGTPEQLARLLDEAPSVAELLLLGDRVRFRLEGGRPIWISPPWELDHHRPPEPPGHARARDDAAGRFAGTMTVRTGSRVERGSPVLGERVAVPALFRLGPRSLEAAPAAGGARPAFDDSEIVGEAGAGKKARVLAPFEWEFPGYGSVFARRVRLIRDYREKAGGSVDLYADLRQFDDNPDDPGSNYRTVGGETLLRGEVDVDDFLGWDDFNLVIVATHGTRDPCPWALPEQLPVRADFETAVEYLEAIPQRLQCPSIWAGLALRDDYAYYPGVEVDAFRVRTDDPNASLTPDEAAECLRLVEEGADNPRTAGGRPCTEIGIREKKMVVLTFAFFQWAYPDGLSDAVVFVGACRSGLNHYLPDQLTGARGAGGNRKVAAFGFEEPVNYADGFAVIDSMIEFVDEGHHSREILRLLQAMPRTTSLVGRALTPDDDALPAEPSAILGRERTATHARDVAVLVDPATGEELEDGATVRVEGVSADGRPDRLRVRAEVIGVAPSDDREAIRLHVAVVGGPDPGTSYPAEDPVRRGAWRWNGPVELGRDHTDGEVVDLEVRAELPGGGESRWVYEDIRLESGTCVVSVSVSGEYSGQWRWTSAGEDFSFTNSLARNGFFRIAHGAGRFEVVHAGPVPLGGASPGIEGVVLIPPAPEGWSAGVFSSEEESATFTLTEHTDERVAGSFRGTITAVPPTPTGQWFGPVPTAQIEVTFDLASTFPGCGLARPRFGPSDQDG